MEEYNAIEVSRILGISDKTVRRYLRKGTIQARRKASGELKIAVSEVEKLRRVLEIEQQSTQDTQSMDTSRQVESLQLKVATLEEMIANLTRRVAELESGPVQPYTPVITDKPVARSISTPPPDVPSGSVLASDLLEGFGFKETTVRRWLKKWIEDGLVEIIEVPRGGNQGPYRYLTQEQQEKMIELLKAEGKL